MSTVFLLKGGLHRQENAKKQQRHKPVSETVTSNTALDPSMSLKVATQSQGTSQVSEIPYLSGYKTGFLAL